MTKYAADYLALTPVWGEVELTDVDFEDRAQFMFEANNFVRDTYDGAAEVDIRNVREIN